MLHDKGHKNILGCGSKNGSAIETPAYYNTAVYTKKNYSYTNIL